MAAGPTHAPPIEPRTEEDERQYQLLATPLGVSGSGMTRYAAAMYFRGTGQLGDELLEAYRICCKLDAEDPIETARLRGASGIHDG